MIIKDVVIRELMKLTRDAGKKSVNFKDSFHSATKTFKKIYPLIYEKGYYNAIEMINRTALIEDKSDLESHERHIKK